MAALPMYFINGKKFKIEDKIAELEEKKEKLIQELKESKETILNIKEVIVNEVYDREALKEMDEEFLQRHIRNERFLQRQISTIKEDIELLRVTLNGTINLAQKESIEEEIKEIDAQIKEKKARQDPLKESLRVINKIRMLMS